MGGHDGSEYAADVLAALKATGPGWQTRVNAAMREWVRSHPAG
ncbi:BrnA antitoxin family protein [Thauera phenylacetica]